MRKIPYITLKWDELLGEGVVVVKDRFFTYEPTIVRLDMLSDCIYELEQLYEQTLEEDRKL